MYKVFILHAWNSDPNIDIKQSNFIRMLKMELESKGFEVKFDKDNAKKTSLDSYMFENLNLSNVIIPICDNSYFERSKSIDSGVYFELKTINENAFQKKTIPLLIEKTTLPDIIKNLEYVDFTKEFESQNLNESSQSLNLLMKIISEQLEEENLIPPDLLNESIILDLEKLGLLTNVINKKDLKLSQIYTYPELGIGADSVTKYTSVKNCLDQNLFFPKSVIIGERQSGKSSLMKMLFLNFYRNELQPVLLEKSDFINRNLDKIIAQKYIKTYSSSKRNKKENIIVLVDDFQSLDVKNQKDIKKLEGYKGIILFIDDIFDLSFTDSLNYNKYYIQPMKPSIRSELIEKLIDVQYTSFANENDRLKKIDESANLINSSLGLGKGYKNGIVPAFPLYILTILGASVNINNRLDSPISSHGHCYQLLINLTFQNCGIENDAIDSYLNFLTNFAIFLYRKKQTEISQKLFDEFLEDYQKDYKIFNLNKYLEILLKTGLIKKNNFLEFSFTYEYIYYFFLGKFFSENFDLEKGNIEEIINNLDVESNGNICIFIAHHSKSNLLIDLLTENLNSLFYEFTESKLDKIELSKMDEEVKQVMKEINLKIGDYKKQRKEDLKDKDKYEENSYLYDEKQRSVNKVDVTTESSIEEVRLHDIRKTIQTVEVVGVILKNRHGSIQIPLYENLLSGAIGANLRLLKSFIEIITEETFMNELERVVRDSIVNDDSEIDEDKFLNEFKSFILKLNLGTIYGIISKTIHSIGSEPVSKYYSELIQKEEIIPSHMLVHRGLELFFEQRLDIKEILKDMNSKETSQTVDSILRIMIIEHASRHKYTFKEKSKIESAFNFKKNSILHIEQQIKSIEK